MIQNISKTVIQLLIAALICIPALVAIKNFLILTPAKYSDLTLIRGINQDGDNISTSQLKGSISLIHTFFTSCPSVCPTLIRDIRSFVELNNLKDKVSVLSVSVDPNRDNVENLKKYFIKHNLYDHNWQLMTGSPNEINYFIEKGLLLNGALNDPNDHSPRVVLVDRNQRTRGYFNFKDATDLTNLKSSLQALLAEDFLTSIPQFFADLLASDQNR